MATKPNQALIYQKVPPFLRNMRVLAGLTQRELGERVKRSQWWVARIESGSRRVDVAEFIEWCIGCGQESEHAIRALAGGSKKRFARKP